MGCVRSGENVYGRCVGRSPAGCADGLFLGCEGNQEEAFEKVQKKIKCKG